MITYEMVELYKLSLKKKNCIFTRYVRKHVFDLFDENGRIWKRATRDYGYVIEFDWK